MRSGGFSSLRGVVVVLGIAGLIGAACGGPSAASSGPTSSAMPTATPAALASPSNAPSPSPAPATTAPSPTVGLSGPLVDGSIAMVTVDKLNLRAGASDSAAIRKTLKAGTRLFVIGGPKVVGSLRWHNVSVITPGSCFFSLAGCNAIGWVATPATGTDAWIRDAPIACPSSPTTAEEINALLPLEQLHCYTDHELVVTGWVDTPCCGYVGPWTFSPDWLAGDSAAFFRMRSGDSTSVVPFAFAPDSGLKPFETTVIIQATAHYDDPAAATCKASSSEGAGDPPPSRADMVLYCRTRLVITDYEVVGYLPGEGGCGCLPPSPKPAG